MELIQAAGRGDISFVRAFLLRDNVQNQSQEIEDQGQVLILTAYNGKIAVVQELLTYGYENLIHFRDDQALINATLSDRLDIVRYLLSRGANVHAQNERALIAATRNNNIPIIQELLNYGANIDRLNPILRNKYWDLKPNMFFYIQEYYQDEPLIDSIRETGDRYIIETNGRYTILEKT